MLSLRIVIQEVPRHVVLALLLAQGGCDAGRRVSPWGAGAGPKLGAYVEKPNLEAHVARIKQETSALGLAPTIDLIVEDARGETFVLMGFEGEDRVGARTTATRIAPGHGVIVAVGPNRETNTEEPTEFVRALGGSSGPPIGFPRDANGDGSLEVLLRGRGGELALLSLSPRGSRTIAVDPPSHGAELSGSGQLHFTREIGCIRATREERTLTVLRDRCEPAPAGVIARPLRVPLSYLGDRFDRETTFENAWHAARAGTLDAEQTNAAGLIRDVLRLEADYHRLMRGEVSTGTPDVSSTADRVVIDRAEDDLLALTERVRLKAPTRGPAEDPGDAPGPHQ